MARIRKEGERGKLKLHEFEIHYAAKTMTFHQKGLPDAVAAFMDKKHFDTEYLLTQEIRKAIVKYEEAATSWSKWIVFRLDGVHRDTSGLDSSSYGTYREKSVIAFDFIVVWFTSDFQFYYTEEERGLTERRNAMYGGRNDEPQPLPADYKFGFFEGSHRKDPHMRKLPYSPELEIFFQTMCDQMKALHGRISSVIADDEMVLQLASANQHLIGPAH